MNDKEYIRKAVELADGYGWSTLNKDRPIVIEQSGNPFGWHVSTDGYHLDALAAQIVRQVDALPGVRFDSADNGAAVMSPQETCSGDKWGCDAVSDGPDRTMNTIKAVVDSKVLE